MALINFDDFYGQSVTIEDQYLYYLQEHLWVQVCQDNVYRFGATHAGVILVNGFKFLDYAVELGDEVDVDDSILFVETFKAMVNLTTPVSGRVFALNDKLVGEGAKILEEKYYEEFMFALKCDGLDEAGVFITAQQYLEALEAGDVDHCGAGARVMRRNR